MAKILVVEDDPDTATLIAARLRADKFVVEIANDGVSALNLMQSDQYDLVVLDRNLPLLNGIEVLTRYRASGGECAIIMLTSLAAVEDKLEGFKRGADDYMPKPFDIRELLVRIYSMLRRPPVSASNILKSGAIVLDPTNHTLTNSGVELHVQKQDFALLEFLLRHQGETFSPEALLNRVWQNDSMASLQGLRMSIMRLRKALANDGSEVSIIENVPRVGYRISK